MFADSKFSTANPICRMLFMHVTRLAASLTDCTAGRSMPIRTPIIAITTRSSTSVNAFLVALFCDLDMIPFV